MTCDDVKKLSPEETARLRDAISDIDIIELAESTAFGLAHSDDYRGTSPKTRRYVCPKCDRGHKTGIWLIEDSNRLYCWHNDEVFDPIALIQAVKKCSYPEALAHGADYLNWTPGEPSTYRRKKPSTAAPQSTEPDKPAPNYSEYLKSPRTEIKDDSPGAAYLRQRGLDLDTAKSLGIRFDPTWRHPDVPDSVPTSPRIIVPMHTGTYEARDIRSDAELERIGGGALRYKKQSVAPKGMFNVVALKQSEPTYITEGWADALAVESAGGHALALNSASQVTKLTRIIASLLELNSAIPPLIMQLDPDDAGRKAQAELTAWLDEHKLRHIDGTICLPDPDNPGGMLDPADSRLADSETFYDRVNADYRRANMTAGEAYERGLQERFMTAFTMFLQNGTPRIPTGLGSLDRQLGGGLFAGLFIFGGRTGSGKTSLALQIADGIAAQGRHVLYVALEMSTLELYAKSLARIAYDMALDRQESPLSYSDIMEGGLKKRTWGYDPVREYANNIAPYMDIYEAIGHTPAETVIERATAIRNDIGTSPVIVVDYLQIMGAHDPRLSDKQAIDANVLGLKQLSRTLDTPVILISSMNRAGYGPDAEPGQKPTQVVTEASYSGSAGIEYTADALIGIERTDPWGDQSPKRSVQTKLLKNRRGMLRPAEGFMFWCGASLFNPYADAVRSEAVKPPLEVVY